MARLEFLANCFFLSIGLVLIGAGILVVPSNAFANAGEDCKDNEKCKGLTGADLGSCVATCCAGSTDTDCCAEACFGDDNYTNCKNACSAAAAQCGTYTTPRL